MLRITVAQLDLLRFAKKHEKKGFTVADAVERFGVSNQSMQIRLNGAVERSWVSRKKENGGGPKGRARYFLNKAGDKVVSRSWKAKKGARFATLAA